MSTYKDAWVKDNPRTPGGRIPMHILIVERALGHGLRRSAQVHHVDGNRKNNANTNLVACDSQTYHYLLHTRQRALDACGNPNWRHCHFCNQYDDPSRMAPYNKTATVMYHKSCRSLNSQIYDQRRLRKPHVR